ncbi:MAG TPA: hypothetical protein PLT00_00425 [Verrucomicrobiota bacterium]|nr:hypothetical protein [Verrucomicrobiota bacterium]HQB15160.1 hypothetical protein [Verrucomicrobiota bacterium]
MKTILIRSFTTGLLLALLSAHCLTSHAQTSAFTYQGQLLENGEPAQGVYDFIFTLYNQPIPRPIADLGSRTNRAVPVTNGYFIATLDFGAAPFDLGAGWLGIAVAKAGSGKFALQSPLQQLTSVPWAMRAEGVSPGSVTTAALAPGAVTSDKIAPGTIVNADISPSAAIADTKLATLSTAGKVANAATTATTANQPDTIVMRNSSGNFSAGAITATGFTGSGSGLTSLNAAQLTAGTLPDARLSSNVARRNAANTFSGNQEVVGSLALNLASSSAGGEVLRMKKSGAAADNNVEFAYHHRPAGNELWFSAFNGTVTRHLQGWDYANNAVRFPANGSTFSININQLRVGVGTAVPKRRFHVAGESLFNGFGSGLEYAALTVTNSASGGVSIFSATSSSDANLVVANRGTGDLIRGFSGVTGGDLVFQVRNNGQVVCGDELSCKSLQIRGGADLAEPFPLSDADAPPGTVLVIDPDQPGRLKISSEAYDSKVAGILSGAGGVQPGIVLTQSGVLEEGPAVALSGRVYAWVDASFAPVQPGDLLTTSPTPGHAMKAVDVERRSGALLGKAMSSLSEGRGLVLVLVSLQ